MRRIHYLSVHSGILIFYFPVLQVTREEGVMLTPCEELLVTLASEPQAPPEALAASHPAVLNIACLPTLADESITKRLLTCMLASLRSKGRMRIYFLSLGGGVPEVIDIPVIYHIEV